jgi:hypothetical protein
MRSLRSSTLPAPRNTEAKGETTNGASSEPPPDPIQLPNHRDGCMAALRYANETQA